MAKKINSGIFKIWASRTKDDLTWLNIIMLVYLTIQSGFVVEWWHPIALVVFLVLRTIWDHKKVIPEQIDYWLSRSEIIKNIVKKLEEK